MLEPDLHVLVGPSLPQSNRERLEGGFVFHPPAVRGSLVAIAKCERRNKAPFVPPVILVIDGEFGNGQAISLTEIRAVINMGATIFGATSIGALRAVEARTVGMTGIGGIFRDYLTGRRVNDSDVAVATSETGVALGPSVCDVDSLAPAFETIHNEPLPIGLIETLRRTYYLDRSYELVHSTMLEYGVPDDVAWRLVFGEHQDKWAAKSHDAACAISEVWQWVTGRFAGPCTRDLSSTSFASPPDLRDLLSDSVSCGSFIC